MIATPCYDGKIDVSYANSLAHTIEFAAKEEVKVLPLWLCFDALIQRARNDLIDEAIKLDVDDMVWIDSDIEWNPDDFFKLLDHPVDVVGGTYRKKGDDEVYVVRELYRRPKDIQTGLLEVDGLGTGFCRMSKKAYTHLWDCSRPYLDPKDNRERHMVFDVVIEEVNGIQSLISEDIHAFDKLRRGGFKVYLDETITCNHTGSKKYVGDFKKWYNNTLRRQL